MAFVLALVLLSSSVGSPALAQGAPREKLRSLDEQVQEIKSDVLSIAAELSRLEEKLLYPSDTHIAVFVSLAENESLPVESIQILINGEPVAHHIYSFQELQALEKGGVQRIYTGNLSTGEHQLEVAVAGTRPGGGAFRGSEKFRFTKAAEPKLVGVTLAGDASIRLGGW